MPGRICFCLHTVTIRVLGGGLILVEVSRDGHKAAGFISASYFSEAFTPLVEQ